ncbi:MAG: hypothetical protein EZS26_002545 [Candidatus Ordinivivax streblomastigis]|uniref:ABC transporter permease n=1 Tax=Candidatus Ordinivivax streblomastigis TaxID=2540710 RepID=A0A5M8NYX1_9BACT|nr:MAG: hypothetical protein EZS26_002545 [Candidatus Ordinivivax streblomastigis]
MKLIWKLLRQHISIGQLFGFFLANLFGMVIILFGVQFYKDVLPAFTRGDSFMKKEYIIVTKKISALGSFAGKDNTFSQEEIKELMKQPFTKQIGTFTPSQFKVYAGLGIGNAGARLSTEMFFESVPDEFIDTGLENWHYDNDSPIIPIIIPRNYLNLYNLGYAQSRNLPQITESMTSLLSIDISIQGNGYTEKYKGKIAGFSNRLNTILVPQSFMTQANERYAPNEEAKSSRLIIEVNNPADSSIAGYFQKQKYDTEDNKLDAGKTTYFLRLVVGMVLGVGVCISLLSFYLLMLSIYLLLQKNTDKVENLLLIGYSPLQVGLPYQILTVGLNLVVLVTAILLVSVLRNFYTGTLSLLFPQWETGSLLPALIAGVLLFSSVSIIHIVTIRKKVMSVWRNES